MTEKESKNEDNAENVESTDCPHSIRQTIPRRVIANRSICCRSRIQTIPINTHSSFQDEVAAITAAIAVYRQKRQTHNINKKS